MVRRITRFQCEKCRKRFSDHREAEDCEIGHIVTDATASFRADLDRILGKQETQP